MGDIPDEALVNMVQFATRPFLDEMDALDVTSTAKFAIDNSATSPHFLAHLTDRTHPLYTSADELVHELVLRTSDFYCSSEVVRKNDCLLWHKFYFAPARTLRSPVGCFFWRGNVLPTVEET